jgi:hypothetical protein
MKRARQLVTTLLAAAATLAVTAAPVGTPPSVDDLAWSPMVGTVSSPLANSTVWSIKVVGDDVYVGGAFTDFAGIAAADRIAKWNGSTNTWEALAPAGATDGAITAGTVYTIAVSGDVVYVGGRYTVDTGAVDCNNLTYFTISTQTWAGFGECPDAQLIPVNPTNSVYNIYADESGGSLYVGGKFASVNGDPLIAYAMVGQWSACVGSVFTTCGASVPEVTVCGGVSVSCAVAVPNVWSPLGDNGSGGTALSDFVSTFAAHPDGGILVAGNFGAAGGVTGANSNARYDATLTPAWYAQDTPSVTMYGALRSGSDLYVSGWEGAHLRTAGNTWRSLCSTQLGVASATYGSMAVTSSGLLLVGGNNLYACDTAVGGQATQISNATGVRTMANYRGAILVGGTGLLGTGGDYIAVLGTILPSTNNNSRQATDTIVLLITLTAFTALAGTQLLRRA